MSIPAILFSIYFAVGVLLMIFAVALPGKESRTKILRTFGGGDALDGWLFVLVAVLWPIWLIRLVRNKGP